MNGAEGALLGPVGFIVAFFFGTIGFFSPCVIPVLPGYLAFLGGVTGEQDGEAVATRKRVVLATGLFVVGFAIVFAALGATGGALGDALIKHIVLLQQISGAIIIILGLVLAVPRLVPALEREYRPFLRKAQPGLRGAVPLGMAFAIGWVPCAGPGLGVMLTLAAQDGSALHGAILLLFFAIGLGTWFMLAALGSARLLRSGWLRRKLRAIQIFGGLFMVVIGVLMLTGRWNEFLAPIITKANRLFGA